MLTEFLEIERKYQRLLSEMTQQFGVTVSEWLLLVKVNAGTNTQASLARELRVDVSTLSRQLKGLVGKKLLAKIPTHQKQVQYEISATGTTVFAQISQAAEKLTQQLFGQLSAADMAKVREFMTLLDHRMNHLVLKSRKVGIN
ncbi:MarR family winged helix-turn-helix transcriptional regulator [Ligilactobacillus equi]